MPSISDSHLRLSPFWDPPRGVSRGKTFGEGHRRLMVAADLRH